MSGADLPAIAPSLIARGAEKERERAAKDRALVEAVQAWASNSEGRPDDPSDAELLKALWTYEGDRTEPCDECDGECGEPCAPCTVAQAHAQLDQFIAKWRRQHGVKIGAAP